MPHRTELSNLFEKTSFYCAQILAVLISFITPIAGVLIAVGAFVFLDTIIGIWKAKKIKQPITFRRMSSVINKMLVYQLTVITFFILGHFIVNDIVKTFIDVDYAMTKIVAVVLISIEFFSIDESFKTATGKGLLERLNYLISKYKENKKSFRKDD